MTLHEIPFCNQFYITNTLEVQARKILYILTIMKYNHFFGVSYLNNKILTSSIKLYFNQKGFMLIL